MRQCFRQELWVCSDVAVVLVADDGEHFDRLGRGQFGDRQDEAGRRAQAQQGGHRAARAGLDDQGGRAGAGGRAAAIWATRSPILRASSGSITGSPVAGSRRPWRIMSSSLASSVTTGSGWLGAQIRPTTSAPRSARTMSTSRSWSIVCWTALLRLARIGSGWPIGMPSLSKVRRMRVRRGERAAAADRPSRPAARHAP